MLGRPNARVFARMSVPSHLTVSRRRAAAATLYVRQHHRRAFLFPCAVPTSQVGVLGLAKAIDTCVGDEKTRGLSGGEAKEAKAGGGGGSGLPNSLPQKDRLPI